MLSNQSFPGKTGLVLYLTISIYSMHTWSIDDNHACQLERKTKTSKSAGRELINYLLFHGDNMADKIKNT